MPEKIHHLTMNTGFFDNCSDRLCHAGDDQMKGASPVLQGREDVNDTMSATTISDDR